MTKVKNKFIVAFTLVFAMLGCLVAPSVANFSAYAADEQYDTLTLGAFDVSTGSFKDATGTEEHTYKSLSFSLACEFVGNEEITLPEVDGYTINIELSTPYSKIIDAATEKTAKEFMEEFFSKIVFKNCEEQTLSVTLNKENVQNKVAYFTNNEHFYMYIKDETKNWDEAYNAAKSMTYLGRQGYLATITSVEEDAFIFEVTGNEVGWLGGTMLKKPANKDGEQYYVYTENEVIKTKDPELYEDHWYWACGPEIDDEFFDEQYLYYAEEKSIPKDDVYQRQKESYRRNAVDNNYYFNWNSYYLGSGTTYQKDVEPNEQSSKMEACLSTLIRGSGYSTGEYIEKYSWNNISYDDIGGTGEWRGAQGYVVEFGDQIIGDSTGTVPASADYVSKIVPFHNHTEGNWEEWTTTDSLPTEAGNYFLGCDVTLSEQWVVPEGTVNFCLNGHVLDLNGNNILVNNSATFNLYNCDDTTSHTGYVDATGLWHLGTGEGTAHTINGGVITGGLSYSNYGGAIEVNNATLNIFGGTLAGNKSFSPMPLLTPYNGGAICIAYNSKSTIYGGHIEYNTALANGGGIYCNGELTIYGGHIENNTAAVGGGIYYDNANANLILGGRSAKILNNKNTDGNASNLYLTREKAISLGTGVYAPVGYAPSSYDPPVLDENDLEVGITLASKAGIFVDAGEGYDYYQIHFIGDDPHYPVVARCVEDPNYSLNLVKVNTITNIKPEEEFDINNGQILVIDMYTGNYGATSAEVGSPILVCVISDDEYMGIPGSLTVNDGNIPVIYYGPMIGETYLFVMPDEDVIVNVEFMPYVERTTNEISVTISGWTYGDTPNTPNLTVSVPDSEDTVVYMYLDNNTYSYTTTVPTEAGSYTILASILGTDSYTDACADCNFTIAKATNEITDLAMADWKVGETPSTPSATAKFGTIVYTYSTEEEGEYTETLPTEVGTYWIKAEVEGTDNYDGAVATKSFKIKSNSGKQENEIKDFSIENITYGETPNPTATATHGTIVYTYSTEEAGTYTTNVPTDAGTYYVKATVEEGDDYEGAEAGPLSFTIAKVQVTKPSEDTTSFAYTGLEQTYTLTTSDDYTISNNKRTDAGSQTVTVALKDKTNYEWADESSSDDLTFTFTIAQATNVWMTVPTIASKTYDGGISYLSYTPKFGADTYIYDVITYYENDVPIAGAPTKAGTYKVVVKVPGTANYTDLQGEATYTISPKTITVSGITAQNKTYDGTTDATLVYTNVIFTGKVGSDVIGVTATGTFADKNVGEGKIVTISNLQIDNTNYVLAAEGNQTSTTANISAKSIEDAVITLDDTDLTYNGEEQTKTISSIVVDDLTLEAETDYLILNNSNKATNAGNYTLTIQGTGNFTGTATKSWAIAKASQEQGTVVIAGYTYGETPSTPSLSVSLEEEPIVTYYYSKTRSTTGGTEWKDITSTTLDGGKYYMYAVVGDTDNYTGYTTLTTEFTVGKSSALVIIWSENTFVYNGEDQSSGITVSYKTLDGTTHVVENRDYYQIRNNKNIPNIGNEEYTGTASNDFVGAGNYTANLTTAAWNSIITTNYKMPGANVRSHQYTIAKASQEQGSVVIAGYTYGGTVSTPSLSESLKEEPTVTYYYSTTNSTTDGTEWKDIAATTLNAGTYYMYAVVEATDNYEGYTTATATQFVVAKASYDMTGASWNYSNAFTYDNTEKTVEVTNLPTGVTVKAYVDNAKTNAGNYTASVTFNYDTTNYNEPTISTLSWVINKATAVIDTTDVVKTYTYTGEEQSVTSGATLNHSETTLTYSNNKFTDVGTGSYTITISAAETTNYLSASTTVDITVNKATGAITVDTTKITKDYGQTITLPTATSNFGTVSCDKTPEDLVNVGTYTVTYTLAETGNYTGDTKTLTVEIVKAKLTKPAADTTSYAYTGAEQTYNIPASDYYTISGNKRTNAGSQTVTVSLKDAFNTCWADETTGDLDYTFTIAKATNEITLLVLDSWIYGKTPSVPHATAKFGEVQFVYSKAEPVSFLIDELPSEIGNYIVKAYVIGNDNYESAMLESEFSIIKQIDLWWLIVLLSLTNAMLLFVLVCLIVRYNKDNKNENRNKTITLSAATIPVMFIPWQVDLCFVLGALVFVLIITDLIVAICFKRAHTKKLERWHEEYEAAKLEAEFLEEQNKLAAKKTKSAKKVPAKKTTENKPVEKKVAEKQPVKPAEKKVATKKTVNKKKSSSKTLKKATKNGTKKSVAKKPEIVKKKPMVKKVAKK